MLYASTRNKTDVFTAYHALHKDRAPDGGMFVPFRLPFYDRDQINALCSGTFADTVAQVLNQFFSAHLNAWDVEFCIGRYPFKLKPMGHRVVVAEIWHNPGASFTYVQQSLYNKICVDNERNEKSSLWARIAIYIAVLFGIYTELARTGLSVEDIAIPAENFTALLAVWYARKMGLPVETVICGCKEDDQIWDFLKKGSLNMSVQQPSGIEHLIYHCLGVGQVCEYLKAEKQNGFYQLTREQLSLLNQGMTAVVSGENRIRSVISGIYRSTGSLCCPATALAFGSLQDYRSRTGGSRSTLILAENSPVYFLNEISDAVGLSATELKKQLT